MLGIAHAARQSLQLVDVTHEVERHDITEGALALEAAAPFFPAGTVHLAVVDPGVGTARRGVALIARRARFSSGRTTGCSPRFSGVTAGAPSDLEAPDYRLRVVSRTFHGRDVFAPAAAHLALGVDAGRLGPPIARSRPARLARGARGDGQRRRCGRAHGPLRQPHHVHPRPLGGATGRSADDPGRRATGAPGRHVRRPAAGPAGSARRLGGRLEIAVREGSAEALLRARRGTPVVVSRTSSMPRAPEEAPLVLEPPPSDFEPDDVPSVLASDFFPSVLASDFCRSCSDFFRRSWPRTSSRLGGRVGRAARRSFGFARLLARLGRVVGDVPALALEDEGRGREQPVHGAAADVALRERRLGDALADLEDTAALAALVLVGGHECRLHGRDKGVNTTRACADAGRAPGDRVRLHVRCGDGPASCPGRL